MMADGDRGRGGYRRRRFYTNKDKDKERHGRGRDRGFDRKEQRGFKEEEKEMKRPIILTKPKPDADKSLEPSIQPTILLKTRDGESRTVSPNPPASPMPNKGEGSNNANYQIATKSPTHPDLRSLLNCGIDMKKCVKLIEDDSIKDGILEFLTDQTDYLVVGALGGKGVGKSQILSRLAYPRPKSRNVFDIQEDKANHCQGTDGIDVFITGGRVIFVDPQSIPMSVVEKVMKKESEDFNLFENDGELLAYQYTAFILSVCHIVLLIQDQNENDDIMKFLLSVEMLKPMTTAQGDDEVIEYAPQLMLVKNRCEANSFSCESLKLLQENFRLKFQNSKLHIETGLGISTGTVMPTLNPELCQTPPANVFLLPKIESKAELKNVNIYRGHLGFHDLIAKFRQQIFAVEPMPLTVTILTEKNWYHYAVKIWENIKKNPNFTDYSRPLPSWTIIKDRSSYGK